MKSQLVTIIIFDHNGYKTEMMTIEDNLEFFVEMFEKSPQVSEYRVMVNCHCPTPHNMGIYSTCTKWSKTITT